MLSCLERTFYTYSLMIHEERILECSDKNENWRIVQVNFFKLPVQIDLILTLGNWAGDNTSTSCLLGQEGISELPASRQSNKMSFGQMNVTRSDKPWSFKPCPEKYFCDIPCFLSLSFIHLCSQGFSGLKHMMNEAHGSWLEEESPSEVARPSSDLDEWEIKSYCGKPLKFEDLLVTRAYPTYSSWTNKAPPLFTTLSLFHIFNF